MPQNLQDWVGRSETVTDTLDLRPAVLMQSVLPTQDVFAPGTPLPPLWNWLYFHQPAPLDKLGRDGHAAKGEFLPPVPLPRRMWAGGRFDFRGDLMIGDRINRVSTIKSVAEKSGKTGPLCFVTVEHAHQRDGETLWREEHDIVYRAEADPDQPAAAPVAPPTGAEITEAVQPSEVMLFRYSALTFNSHRIHYDRPYVREVEGYPDLVFHGPLTATLLADLCRRNGATGLRTFHYRAMAPLFDTAPFTIRLRPTETGCTAWAETPDGALAMKADATFA